MSEFCIIGSGISGATIANLLNKRYSVILFDKARGPGGRASFKRIKGKTGFDHGTQYISPKTKKLKKFTKDLIKKKILKVWGGKHVFLNSKKKEDKKHLKIIGKNGGKGILVLNAKQESIIDNALFSNLSSPKYSSLSIK